MTMSKERKVKFTCIAKHWFDKVNGNTYHSVRITRHKDDEVITGVFQYGYEDQYGYEKHYKQAAIDIMYKAGWLPRRYTKATDYNYRLSTYERRSNYPILWDVSDGSERACKANGKL